jgi:hypothetical protein
MPSFIREEDRVARPAPAAATPGRKTGAAAPIGVASAPPKPVSGRSSRPALLNVLVFSFLASAALGYWVFVHLGGWAYYTMPLGVRGYAPQHQLLRPTGSIAHPLGFGGFALLTMPVLYAVRKNWKALRRLGSMPAWLNAHIFCGIVGPVAVTLHSGFKFNGIVSVAYWAMFAVMLSGFVGRYWYVRIPQTIRGTEMTLDDIQARVEALKLQLECASLDAGLLERVHAVDQEVIAPVNGRLLRNGAVRARLRHLRRDLRASNVERQLVADISGAISEQAWLVRRIGRLKETKRLFGMWYIFHRPLVYVMFGVAFLHVGVAMYFGYRWW